MLIVIGLNHRMGACIDCPVGGEGVKRVAQAIYEAWPHPENVVVVGSALDGKCTCLTADPPVPPQRLADELKARYEQPFTVSVAESPDSRWPGFVGVVSGSRWVPTVPQRLQYTDWHALVHLRDAATGLTVPVFAMHTGGVPVTSVDDMKLATAKAKADVLAAARAGHATYTVPILAGDFNFTEKKEGDNPLPADLAELLRGNVFWSNKDVACVESRGRPVDTMFQAQDGNKMHAFIGLLQATDPTFSNECSVADFERLRFSYSIDATGQLALRPGDDRVAQSEGIILDGIAHNVIALGLSIRRRADPLPKTCATPPTPTCGSATPWCDCSGRCDSRANCRRCEGGGPTCTAAKPYCDCVDACRKPSECDRVCR